MIAPLAAFLIGCVAGLRAMTAPALVAWAAQFGWIDLGSGSLAFVAELWVAWLLTVLALGELVSDKLPMTPSRTVPLQFGTRLLSGGFCGAALGLAAGQWGLGLLLGLLGAVVGTLGGRALRAALARRCGALPAALLEDLLAIGGGLLVLLLLT